MPFAGVATAGNQWNTTATRGSPVTAGTLSNLYVYAPNALSAGQSYAVTVMVNGSATGLTCTVDSTGLFAFDNAHTVSVVDGDYVQYRVVPTGTPVAQANGMKFGLAHTATATDGSGGMFSSFVVGSTALSSTAFAALNRGDNATQTTTTQSATMPCAGTMNKLIVKLGTAPGTGSTRAITVVKNGVDTGLTVSISGTGTTGSVTSAVSWVAGDTVYVKTAVSGAVAAASSIYIAVEWTPTNAGEVPYFGGGLSPSQTATQYGGLTGLGTFGATEDAAVEVSPIAFTITGLRVDLATATGAGKSRTTTIRDNATNTVASVVMSDASATSGTWSATVNIAAGRLVSVQASASGTPAVNAYTKTAAIIKAASVSASDLLPRANSFQHMLVR